MARGFCLFLRWKRRRLACFLHFGEADHSQSRGIAQGSESPEDSRRSILARSSRTLASALSTRRSATFAGFHLLASRLRLREGFQDHLPRRRVLEHQLVATFRDAETDPDRLRQVPAALVGGQLPVPPRFRIQAPAADRRRSRPPLPGPPSSDRRGVGPSSRRQSSTRRSAWV